MLGFPHNADVAARCTYDTVNAIWYARRRHVKRLQFLHQAGFAGRVYGATVLYWLEDKSEECVETWSFLDRRLDNVMKLPTIPQRFTELLNGFTSPLARFRPRTRRSFRARR